MRWLLVLLILGSIGCSREAAPNPTPASTPSTVITATPGKATPDPEPQAQTPTPNAQVQDADPEPQAQTPTPNAQAQDPEPDRVTQIPQPAAQLQPRTSPIQWPEGELEIAPSDRIVISRYVGGVAGTDTDQISIFGDGTVIVESGRAGGPGGNESKVKHQISAELTREIFQKIRSSKLLDHTEPSGNTTGASLFVRYNDQEDRVSIPGRLGEAEMLVSKARSSK